MDVVRISGMSSALAAFAKASAFSFMSSKGVDRTHPIVPTWWSIRRTAVFSGVKRVMDMSPLSPVGELGERDSCSNRYRG